MADQKADAKQEPAAQPPVTVVIQQPDRAADGARAMAEGRALNMDTTVPGGKYLVNDVLVNADGQPIKDEK